MCMSGAHRGQNRGLGHWNQRYGWLWPAMCVLGIEHRSSGRVDGPLNYLVISPVPISTLLLSQGLSLNVELTDWVGRMVRELQGFTSLCFSSTKVTDTWLCMWVLGIQTQTLLFMQQSLSPLNPSSILRVFWSSELCSGVTISIFNV